jgi:hypothetical protein
MKERGQSQRHREEGREDHKALTVSKIKTENNGSRFLVPLQHSQQWHGSVLEQGGVGKVCLSLSIPQARKGFSQFFFRRHIPGSQFAGSNPLALCN